MIPVRICHSKSHAKFFLTLPFVLTYSSLEFSCLFLFFLLLLCSCQSSDTPSKEEGCNVRVPQKQVPSSKQLTYHNTSKKIRQAIFEAFCGFFAEFSGKVFFMQKRPAKGVLIHYYIVNLFTCSRRRWRSDQSSVLRVFPLPNARRRSRNAPPARRSRGSELLPREF